MERLSQYVDVFLGCGAIDLPQSVGIAKKWRFIKGLAGNTTPAAALPFSKMTACAYSGGYSQGYGNIGVNSGEPLRRIMPEGTVRGISHIHSDGIGFTGTFYNYALTAPYFGEDPGKAFEPETMTHEEGRPGYYAAEMRDVLCELTVTRHSAQHRYTFPREGGRVALDFTNDGLIEEVTRRPCADYKGFAAGEDTFLCEATLHGLKLYFAVRCPGAKVTPWEKGCFFDIPGREARLGLGISPRSMGMALQGAAECEKDFDLMARTAQAEWDEVLSAIDIGDEDERTKRLFYSCLYHTLTKPSDWQGESFLYADEEAFTLDFATLWDMYKCQMPLIFTLYPKISERIVRTILAYCRATGRMPHMLLLERQEVDPCAEQARMLAEFVLMDAWIRGVPMDLKEVAHRIRDDLMPEGRFADYKETGVCEDIAHTVDMADGCGIAALFAQAAGDEDMAEKCRAWAGKWVAAFDRDTGLLRSDSRFYEGNHWNYSFRLMRDMKTRLDIAGGKEGYARLLDQFFGFSLPEGEKAAFEGFNNETDMETPYAYHDAGRHDRLCQVIHDGMASMFTLGRGGLPGNNDSGGLTSMYLWNVMGVFPVSGQDRMIIGTPALKRVSLRLASGLTFTIQREGSSIYVQEAVLNGRRLDQMEFAASDMMRGGELRLVMTDRP